VTWRSRNTPHKGGGIDMKHPWTRGDRRFRTERIARWRASLYPSQNNFAGRFRKWNMTCQCSMCCMEKYCDIQLQRMKDKRRNVEFEEVGP